MLVDYISYQDFLSFFSKHPVLTNKDYYSEFPDTPKGTVRYWKMKASKGVNKTPTSVDTTKKKSRSNQPIPPTKVLQQTLESIENPVAYTTAHIFERMIKTGDYRWAQLFVQVLEKTNKLDYETIREQEWLKQANNMSMRDLVEKVAKKESISRSTLRRLDELEDTSQYENL